MESLPNSSKPTDEKNTKLETLIEGSDGVYYAPGENIESAVSAKSYELVNTQDRELLNSTPTNESTPLQTLADSLAKFRRLLPSSLIGEVQAALNIPNTSTEEINQLQKRILDTSFKKLND